MYVGQCDGRWRESGGGGGGGRPGGVTIHSGSMEGPAMSTSLSLTGRLRLRTEDSSCGCRLGDCWVSV